MCNKTLEKAGCIDFDNKLLDVYGSLDEPLFNIIDVAHLIGYGTSEIQTLFNLCEYDERFEMLVNNSDQELYLNFVNENGLYNILSQSYTDTSRKWRRIIHDELVNLRKSRSMNIIQQFDMWDDMLDDLYIDEETGILMQSVTIHGGDVIQIPYKGK